MTTQSIGARLLAVALGSILCVPAAFSEPAAGTGAWSKVPALPTACYSGTDPFVAKLDAAVAAVNASRTKQLATNAKIEKEYKSIEPMEMASRMQQWMMSNPEEATKYMQGVQAVGDDFNARMPEMTAAGQRFESEQKDLAKRYNASLDKAYAPGHARHAALKKKIGTPLDYPTVKDPATPDWAIVEENAIMRELDQAYSAHCPQWWAASSPVQAWLKTYRTWLNSELTPFSERLGSQNAQTYAIMGTPSASWRTVAVEDGVLKYLDAVGTLYGLRREKPRCDAADCGHM